MKETSVGVQSFSWLLLTISIGAEVVGTIALRFADGFTRPLPSLLVGISYATAIWLMSLAVKKLEIGLAYAVWAGGGTALVAIFGAICFGESMTFWRSIGIVMIVLGVVALNLDA
jgi:small multidrug resistance pump